MMLRTALLLLVAAIAIADTAADVLNVFTSAAEGLINDDAASFLDRFDRNMPGYAALQNNVEGLLAAYDVGATIEEITDEGDDRKRTVERKIRPDERETTDNYRFETGVGMNSAEHFGCAFRFSSGGRGV